MFGKIRRFLYLICKPKNEDWKPKVESYNSIVKDKDKVNFIYKTLQERLQSTIDSQNFLEKKILLLLSYLISVNTIVVGYIIKHYDKVLTITNQNLPFYWQLLTIFGIFSFSIACLIATLRPKNFYFKGNDAENLFEDKICSLDINTMILAEAIPYKDRVDYNQERIEIGRLIFNAILFLVFLSPILFLF